MYDVEYIDRERNHSLTDNNTTSSKSLF